MNENITDDLELLVTYVLRGTFGQEITRTIHRLSYDSYIVTTCENGEHWEDLQDETEVLQAMKNNEFGMTVGVLHDVIEMEFHEHPEAERAINGVPYFRTGIGEYLVGVAFDPRTSTFHYYIVKPFEIDRIRMNQNLYAA
jgi:hypothetical protein